jgi:hypothetical protein
MKKVCFCSSAAAGICRAIYNLAWLYELFSSVQPGKNSKPPAKATIYIDRILLILKDKKIKYVALHRPYVFGRWNVMMPEQKCECYKSLYFLETIYFSLLYIINSGYVKATSVDTKISDLAFVLAYSKYPNYLYPTSSVFRK